MFWGISEQFYYWDQGHKINSSSNCLVSINWQPRETSVNYPSEDCIAPRASQSQKKLKVRLGLYPVGQIPLTPSPLLLSCEIFATSFNWPRKLSWNTLIFSTTTHQMLLLSSCLNAFTILASFHHGPVAENRLLYWEKAQRYFDTGIWEHSVFKVYIQFSFSVKIYLHFTIRKCT